MTALKWPLSMGALMGVAMPWMVHNGGADFGVAFIAAHVAIVLGGLAALFVFPTMRRRMKTVAAHARHAPFMVMGMVAGFAATCVVCFLIGGQHWT